ncbi:hypothetical protein NBRC10512_000804 [Rhodotorula toruloides]|uniref:Uncharacterized protein n=1 Tax=Rhodotorula toruloides (strain NP11) TaxID=1130832 RepID=M7X2N6_RHOT1|nr:uncharacterized protein RHTO_06364 [Rhodotorula toruloides NP11]EMS24360.1 hypothetical protein RHTO_06364 [Rhodotorula toruloides NP11]
MSGPVRPEGSLSTAELRRQYSLGVYAVPLDDRTVFIDFEDPRVRQFVRDHDILPQRKVHPENVKRLSESLEPGSLDNSIRTPGTIAFFPLALWDYDRARQDEIRAARRAFVAKYVAREDDPPQYAEGDTAVNVPPMDHRRPARLSVLDTIPLDELETLGLYLCDGNHRAAVMTQHKQVHDAKVVAGEAEPAGPLDYALAFELFAEDVFFNAALFFTISLELNQIHARTSILADRSVTATLIMTRFARVRDASASTEGFTVVSNDYGSLVTARYRFQAVNTHPSIAFMLDSLGKTQLYNLNGYGGNGVGPGIIFLLLGLRDTARFFSVIDPAGDLVAGRPLLENLARRYGRCLPNPLFYADEVGDDGTITWQGVRAVGAAAGDLAKGLLKIPARAFKNDKTPVREAINAFASRIQSIDAEDGATVRWEERAVKVRSAVVEQFFDLHTLATLDASETVDDSTLDSPSPSTTVDRKPQINGKGARAAAQKYEITTLYRHVHAFSTAWLLPLAHALSALVPLAWSHSSRSPLAPPRLSWHDPFLILLALHPDARSRLEKDPFGPIGGFRIKFERIPVEPFGENAQEAAALIELAEYVWRHRQALMSEYQAATAAASRLSDVQRDKLASDSAPVDSLRALPSSTISFLLPFLIPTPFADLGAPVRLSLVAFYPSHRALFLQIAELLSLPDLTRAVESIVDDLVIHPETGLSPADLRIKAEKEALAVADAQNAAAARDRRDDEAARHEPGEVDVDAADGGDDDVPAPEESGTGADEDRSAGEEDRGALEGMDDALDGSVADEEDLPAAPKRKKLAAARARVEDDEEEDANEGADADERDPPTPIVDKPLVVKAAAGDALKRKGPPDNDHDPSAKRPKQDAESAMRKIFRHLLVYFGATVQATLSEEEGFVYTVTELKAGTNGRILLADRVGQPVFLEEIKRKGKLSWIVGYRTAQAAAPLRKFAAATLTRANRTLSFSKTKPPALLRPSDYAFSGRLFLSLAAVSDPSFKPHAHPSPAIRNALDMACTARNYNKLLTAIIGTGDAAEERRLALVNDTVLQPADEGLRTLAAVEASLAEAWGKWIALMDVFDGFTDAGAAAEAGRVAGDAEDEAGAANEDEELLKLVGM